MLFVEEFRSPYPFPDHDTDPKKKKELQFCFEFSKAIHAQYCTDKSGIGNRDRKNFSTLRAFSDGRQPVGRYQRVLSPGMFADAPETPSTSLDILTGVVNPGDEVIDRKGYMNILWETVSVAPKYRRVVVDRYDEIHHDIFVDGLDEGTMNQKEEAKWQLWVETTYNDLLQGLDNITGAERDVPEFVPKSKEELDMYASMGGFKIKTEIALEKAIPGILHESDSEEIKRRVLGDLHDLNFAATKDYVDRKTQRVKARYVDPERFVISYSKTKKFKKIYHAGEYVEYNLAELRALLPKLTEQAIKGIVEKYKDSYSNRSIYDRHHANEDNDTLDDYWEKHKDYTVLVLDCEYLTSDKEYSTKIKNKHGDERMVDQKYGKMYEGEDKQTVIADKEVYYRCKYVVGTDYCFDYGLQYDIPRSNDLKEAMSSFHAYKVPGKSIVELMIPYIDQFQLAWFRLQNAIAKARPKGLAIEVKALQNISLNGKNLGPLDLIQISREDGTLLYSNTNSRSHMPAYSGGLPFAELEGGIGKQMVEYHTIMQTSLDGIAELTGVPRIEAGGAPEPRSGLGLNQMAASSSYKATNHVYKGWIHILEGLAVNSCRRLQLWITNRDNQAYEIYSKAYGKNTAEILKIGGEEGTLAAAIRITARPSLEEKERIYTAALESMKAGKSGYGGLETSDFLMITRMIDLGQLKYAEMMLRTKEASAKRLEQEKAQQATAQQIQGQQEVEAQKHQQEIDLLKTKGKVETDREVAKINAKAAAEERMLALRVQLGLEQLASEKAPQPA